MNRNRNPRGEWIFAIILIAFSVAFIAFEIALIAGIVQKDGAGPGIVTGVLFFIVGNLPLGFLTLAQTACAADATQRKNRRKSNSPSDRWVIERPCQGVDRHGNYKHSMSKHGAWYLYPASLETCELLEKGTDRIVKLSELPAPLQNILTGAAGPLPPFGLYLSPKELADLGGLEAWLKQFHKIAA